MLNTFQFLLLLPFWITATRTIARFLTKLWADLFPLCDFQLWKDDFFKLWVFLWPHAYKYCVCIISLFLPCPRPQRWLFDQTRSEITKVLRIMYIWQINHLASTFLAAFLLTREVCLPILTLKVLVSTSELQPSGPSASPEGFSAKTFLTSTALTVP